MTGRESIRDLLRLAVGQEDPGDRQADLECGFAQWFD